MFTKRLPFLLVYSRLVMALLFPVFAYLGLAYANLIAGIMIFGLLTDVFDGIIARKVGVSSERLRVLDSNIDQLFWLSAIASIFYLRWSGLNGIVLWVGVLLVMELSTYVISYLKFKRTIATHTILAKFWTISMLVFLVELCVYGTGSSFLICFILGLISRLEIIAIVLFLKTWSTDIPSILQLGKINRGEPIKKSQLFNS